MLAVAAMLGVASLTVFAWPRGIAFDQQRWQLGEKHDRHAMADRLVSTGELIGQTRAQIEAKLGPPTPTNKWADWDLIYVLGRERGWMPIDSEWLVIRLDAAGNATECRVVRD